MPFKFQPLAIPEVVLIEARAFSDARGRFAETYKLSEFAANGLADVFVQDNHSHSVRGVLRGLHFQNRPRAQAKLVMALSGEVFDVAVDIRRGSPTYGHWVSATLSAENGRMLYIPAGFAHGFCVLSDCADLVYKCTAEYAPELDRGILWQDPALAIAWPISGPLLSAKDAALPPLAESDHNLAYAR
jgi:dTDP-4-dehydrorhamnose 3,5-epimerase